MCFFINTVWHNEICIACYFEKKCALIATLCCGLPKIMSPRLLQGPWNVTKSLRSNTRWRFIIFTISRECRTGQVSVEGWVCRIYLHSICIFIDISVILCKYEYIRIFFIINFQDPLYSPIIVDTVNVRALFRISKAAPKTVAYCSASKLVLMCRALRAQVKNCFSIVTYFLC